MQVYNQGEVVKYSTPQDPQEAENRFIVLEDREDRLYVQLVCDWNLKPTFCFAKSEFTKA